MMMTSQSSQQMSLLPKILHTVIFTFHMILSSVITLYLFKNLSGEICKGEIIVFAVEFHKFHNLFFRFCYCFEFLMMRRIWRQAQFFKIKFNERH